MSTDWRELAACRTYPVDVMYPERGDTAGQEAAKAICATCPVQHPCLVQALKDGEQDGYFGGMSGRARRALKRSDYVTVRCVWPSCGKEFAQRQPQIVCCSEECSRKRRNWQRQQHSYKAYRDTLTKS